MDFNKNNKEGLKLENIERKNIYRVPEGYFGKLSTQIQQKVASEKNESYIFGPVLKWSLGTFAFAGILVSALYFINHFSDPIINNSIASQSEKPEPLTSIRKNTIQVKKDSIIHSAKNIKRNDMNSPLILSHKINSERIKEPQVSPTLSYSDGLLANISMEDISSYLDGEDMDVVLQEDLNITF